MYVCVCNAVTDREIRACAELGCRTVEELRQHIGVASCCGRCAPAAEEVLREHVRCDAGRAAASA